MFYCIHLLKKFIINFSFTVLNISSKTSYVFFMFYQVEHISNFKFIAEMNTQTLNLLG